MGKPAHRKRADQQLLSRLRSRRRKLIAELGRVETDLVKQSQAQPPSPVQVDHWLDDLTRGLPDLPPLPTDFSRADVYSDHD